MVEELKQLTLLIGSVKKTAEELGISERTYWTYRKGDIPSQAQILIRVKLDKAVESKTFRQKASV